MGWWCVPPPRSLLFCSCIPVCGNLSLCSLGQQVPSGGTITYVSFGDGGCLSGTASISTWCIQSGAPPSTVSVCACVSWARVQGWELEFRAKPALPPGEHSLQNSTWGLLPLTPVQVGLRCLLFMLACSYAEVTVPVPSLFPISIHQGVCLRSRKVGMWWGARWGRWAAW